MGVDVKRSGKWRGRSKKNMTAAGSCSMGWHACQINASMNSLARLTIRHLWGYEHIQLTNQPLPQVAKKSSRVITL